MPIKAFLSHFLRIVSLLVVVNPILASKADQSVQLDFPSWLQKTIQKFHDQGFDKAFLRQAFDGVEYDSTVIKLLNTQPEYQQTFNQYVRYRLTESRIQNAKQAYQTHQPILTKIEALYGVPAEIIVALWSLETNLGSYLGSHYVIQSLATLAFDSRRKVFFAAELEQALTLMQQNQISAEVLRGSWAGAMGHPQFMPSTYLNYAIDGNQDGSINLWQQLDDVFHSAGNYLQKMNWAKDEPWLMLVKLGEKFDYTKVGIDWSLPIQQWITMGVEGLHNQAIIYPNQYKASIVLPSGVQGPAFMVFNNFRAILRWNRSVFYALSVGLLADIIAERFELEALPLSGIAKPLSLKRIKQAQQRLNALGLYVGEVDGLIGAQTTSAIRAFQQQRGLVADGYLSAELLELLLN